MDGTAIPKCSICEIFIIYKNELFYSCKIKHFIINGKALTAFSPIMIYKMAILRAINHKETISCAPLIDTLTAVGQYFDSRLSIH